ncbi:MAG: hypothetical protein LBL07_13010 [Tannerella sp.]|jgi:hypothetical protein|nr:hypothetical protein [Tannerella sp.]
MTNTLIDGMKNAGLKKLVKIMTLSAFLLMTGLGTASARGGDSQKSSEPAQNKTRITGTVVDRTGEPVIGANEGLRARGGYDVDMAWEEGKLSKAIIKAHYDKTCRLRAKTPVKVFAGSREIPCKPLDGNCVEFEAKSNETYRIEPIK